MPKYYLRLPSGIEDKEGEDLPGPEAAIKMANAFAADLSGSNKKSHARSFSCQRRNGRNHPPTAAHTAMNLGALGLYGNGHIHDPGAPASSEAHVGEGVAHIENQKTLTAEMELSGHDTAKAKATAIDIRKMQAMHRADRYRLSSELEEAQRR